MALEGTIWKPIWKDIWKDIWAGAGEIPAIPEEPTLPIVPSSFVISGGNLSTSINEMLGDGYNWESLNRPDWPVLRR